ncbi:histidine kinase/DNA gyrase B/HSP90-like ATPase [Spirosoma oryzae]|uniref:histidine kinase n=1 Tax=Spirosoma oryzae TaxID=1469603 RepID=A0A2T0TN59_9BACT|nr:ATP-binding protein [Spirosoma oryzae]PRY47049.1 histidine kinase/DNA gyrase B/HSP90-like ATPase [Spirosoma oryzae]
MNRTDLALPLRAGLLLLTLTGLAYALVTRQPVYWLPILLVAVGQIWELMRYLNRQNRELTDFLDALRYQDFSSNLSTVHAPASVRQARQLLNQINQTFSELTREKEAQHLYLQNVLALVNTGILSYRDDDLAVGWMNESLKRLLQVPYVNTLEGFRRRNPALHAQLLALRPGESKVFKVGAQAVLLSATAFTDETGRWRLVAFQPMSEALEANEALAYQKILRVLNHEIMNSIAPIASLAETLHKRLHTEPATVDELRTGIGVIRTRSEGLLQFSQTYRNLSKFSTASLQPVRVIDLIESVLTLFEPTLAQRDIDPDVIVPDMDMVVLADPVLIEQVLINLLTNALDALRDQAAPTLAITALPNDEHRPLVSIADNGPGIPDELIDEIFVPFFTTKPHGSGIGLSLSRQIMQLHRGSIQLQSTVGKGSTFSLLFSTS